MSVTSCRLPIDGFDLRRTGIPGLNPESTGVIEWLIRWLIEKGAVALFRN